MNLFELALNFVIFIDGLEYEEVSVFEPDDGKVMASTRYSEDQYTFAEDAPVTFKENGRFSVTTFGDEFTESEEITFIAYRKVDWKSDLPERSDDPRAINLADARIEVTEPNRMWVKVGKFDVLLNHTHEGLIVDVLPWVEEDGPGYSGDALATLCVEDSDADDALGLGEDE